MTSMTRYSPTFSWLRTEIDSLFDDVLGTGDGEAVRSALWSPHADVSETDDHYVLRMDLPGLTKKDVDIALEDDVLTVSGERRSEHVEDGETVRRVERSRGRFYRSFTLPKASDTEKVRATMKEGVLTIEVPKRESSKPRRIEIS